MEKIDKFFHKTGFPYYPLVLHSRIHKIRNLTKNQSSQVYLKRDDELSFGIPGTKYRKFSSLIGYILKLRNPLVLLHGSEYSNSVYGLAGLLREAEIPFHCILKRAHNQIYSGNSLLKSVLIEDSEISLYSTKQEQEKLVEAFKEKFASSFELFEVPEGANCFEAIPGAMTLAMDIPEKFLRELDTIYIDSGTGVAAIGMILGLAYSGFQSLQIKVVLIAGNQDEFFSNLKHYEIKLEEQLQTNLSGKPNIECLAPTFGKSFGSTNARCFDSILNYSRKLGVLSDPIYMAKTLSTAFKEIEPHKNALIIHSGGGHSIHGFNDKFSNLFNKSASHLGKQFRSSK